jgi:hypothetical protein
MPASILKPLPLGIQTFDKIIKGGYIYAGNTSHILRMLRPYRRVFLSRPRRFGKSLLLSVIKELFLGRRKLFQGLSMESSGYDFAPCPVIHLSMKFDTVVPNGQYSPQALLYQNIIDKLKKIAAKEGLEIEALGAGGYLEDLGGPSIQSMAPGWPS